MQIRPTEEVEEKRFESFEVCFSRMPTVLYQVLVRNAVTLTRVCFEGWESCFVQML